jgi:hypothetical protein
MKHGFTPAIVKSVFDPCFIRGCLIYPNSHAAWRTSEFVYSRKRRQIHGWQSWSSDFSLRRLTQIVLFCRRPTESQLGPTSTCAG